MSKIRSVFLVLLVCILLTSSIAYAGENVNNITISEKAHLQELERLNGDVLGADKDIDWHFVVGAEGNIAPDYICIDCEWFCVTVCAAEANLYGEGYHKPLFQPQCYVHYFNSRGAMMCPSCLKVWEQYGYHDCWEIHDSCSKGWYDVCPMDVS